MYLYRKRKIMRFGQRSGLKGFYLQATSMKARMAGLQLGERPHVSPGGKYLVSKEAQVVVGDDVLLGRDHHLEAVGSSQIQIGKNVRFHERVHIRAVDGAQIRIGDNCYFHHDVAILAHTSITIGADGIFAAFCYLSDHNHEIDRHMRIKDQGFKTEPLVVGDDVWLGVGATLIKGANLGEGVVIAARAVVNKTVPDYEIWGGVPARKLGER